MTPEMTSFFAWINLTTLFFVVVGALNWLFIGILDFNCVAWLSVAVGWLSLAKVVYIVVGISALLHVISRDYYLPFLGQTAYPCGSLMVKRPDGADTTVTVRVAPNSSVVYWAAEKKTDSDIVKNPWLAYSEFANTGVAKSDAQGNATLVVRKPVQYRVPPFGAKVHPHVHYRTCNGKGMLGNVKTVVIQSSNK